MGRLTKKGKFMRSTFIKPPGKEEMLLSPLFFSWGGKGRDFLISQHPEYWMQGCHEFKFPCLLVS